jgi:prevent-host-death family protein
MRWKLGEAKQRLSEVVRAAEDSPQILLNRDRPVAVLVGGKAMEALLARRPPPRGLAEALDALGTTCREEDYALEVPARTDRPNAMLERQRAPRRHQRHQ